MFEGSIRSSDREVFMRGLSSTPRLSVCRLPSSLSWLAPVEWFPLQLLYCTLRFFARHWGCLEVFYLSERHPVPLLFVEPLFSFGTLAIPVCPAAHSFGVLLLALVRFLLLGARSRFDFSQLTWFCCTFSLFLHPIHFALPSHHPALDGRIVEPFLRSLHLYITWVSS